MEELSKIYQPPICSICHDDLDKDLVTVHCGHVFHSNCLFRQLEFSKKCPLCKNTIQNCTVIKLIYEIQEQNLQVAEMKKFIQNLPEDEKMKIDHFIVQNQELLSKNQKLEKLIKDFQEDHDKLSTKFKEQEKDLKDTKYNLEQRNAMKKEIQAERDCLQIEKQELLKENEVLNQKIESYEIQVKNLGILKQFQDELKQHVDLERFIERVESKSYLEQCNELKMALRYKNCELMKKKQENQILKNQLDEEKKEKYKNDISMTSLKQSLEEETQRRKKLQIKNQKLEQKLKNNDIIFDENSNNSFEIVQKNKPQQSNSSLSSTSFSKLSNINNPFENKAFQINLSYEQKKTSLNLSNKNQQILNPEYQSENNNNQIKIKDSIKNDISTNTLLNQSINSTQQISNFNKNNLSQNLQNFKFEPEKNNLLILSKNLQLENKKREIPISSLISKPITKQQLNMFGLFNKR